MASMTACVSMFTGPQGKGSPYPQRPSWREAPPRLLRQVVGCSGSRRNGAEAGQPHEGIARAFDYSDAFLTTSAFRSPSLSAAPSFTGPTSMTTFRILPVNLLSPPL